MKYLALHGTRSKAVHWGCGQQRFCLQRLTGCPPEALQPPCLKHVPVMLEQMAAHERLRLLSACGTCSSWAACVWAPACPAPNARRRLCMKGFVMQSTRVQHYMVAPGMRGSYTITCRSGNVCMFIALHSSLLLGRDRPSALACDVLL